MPTLPWTTVTTPASGDVTVMASRFVVKSWRDVLPFFRDAMRVHAQVRQSEGAVGVSLIAHPLKREFFTLSSWTDRAALNAMVRAEPHRSVMLRHREATAASGFVFWNQPASDAVTWPDAQARLAAATAGE